MVYDDLSPSKKGYSDDQFKQSTSWSMYNDISLQCRSNRRSASASDIFWKIFNSFDKEILSTWKQSHISIITFEKIYYKLILSQSLILSVEETYSYNEWESYFNAVYIHDTDGGCSFFLREARAGKEKSLKNINIQKIDIKVDFLLFFDYFCFIYWFLIDFGKKIFGGGHRLPWPPLDSASVWYRFKKKILKLVNSLVLK